MYNRRIYPRSFLPMAAIALLAATCMSSASAAPPDPASHARPPADDPGAAKVYCEMKDPVDEVGQSLARMCETILGPIIADDIEAWIEVTFPRVLVSGSLIALQDPQAGVDHDRWREEAEKAGGLPTLFGLSTGAPVVVRLEEDCRKCRRGYFVLRLAERPNLSFMVEGERVSQIGASAGAAPQATPPDTEPAHPPSEPPM